MMHLTFGMFLDGAQWSDKEASLGEVRLGPTGMLGFLETWLGLLTRPVSLAWRINEYLERMKRCDSTDKWFHLSLEADPWSTEVGGVSATTPRHRVCRRLPCWSRTLCHKGID